MNGKRKIGLHLRLILMLHFVFSCSLAYAQNNPYKIKDNLYPMLQKIMRDIRKPETAATIDSLTTAARKEGDVKAQCLALTMWAEYYYYCQNDIEKLKVAAENARLFAVHTPYKQYVFAGWNRVLDYYVSHLRLAEAMQEGKAFQKEALRLNNHYGIASSYRHLARIYSMLGQDDALEEQLKKGIDYLLSVGETQELDDFYAPLGSIYMNRGDTEMAHYYYEKARQYNKAPMRLTEIDIKLMLLSCSRRDTAAAEKYYELMDAQIAKYGLTSAVRPFYHQAMVVYKLLHGDFEEALHHRDSIWREDKRFLYSETIYSWMGDYKKAYEATKKYQAIQDSLKTKANADIISRNAELFNNQQLELEKNRLVLQNVEMQLKESQANERILALDMEQNRLNQENAKLELNNKSLTIRQQESALKQRELELKAQKDRAASLEQLNRNHRILTYVVGAFVFCILGALAFYYRKRVHYIHQLEQEKRLAQEARQKAEAADKMKALFLQNMSHEIRTPLNAIVGFTDVLNTPGMDLDEEEKSEMLHLIYSNTELLTTLLNDILDLSKLESGTYELDIAPVDVARLCRTTLESVAHRAPQGVDIRFDLPEESNLSPDGKPASELILHTDAARLQQVLTNFLTNACKYTSEGSIVLTYGLRHNPELERDEVQFSVTDTGCGIPPEKAEKIFNRFEKLDNFKQGTGLGLNICRLIADLMKGKLYVDKSHTGGARFVFDLPMRHVSQERATQEEGIGVGDVKIGLLH